MDTLSPVAIALLIVLPLAAIGGIVAVIRRITTFRSYQDLANDADDLAKALKGDVFRDGNDLVVSGNHGSWPAVVRFSYSETMPGLDIRMEVPANFTLWFAPRGAAVTEGRAPLRTADPAFDSRFSTRSDHPTQASLLLGGKHMLPVLQKLCCSANTYLKIAPGTIELAEEVTPRPYTARHVLDHVTGMARLADFLRTMPGAQQVKIKPIHRERHIAGRVAIAAGVLVAILTVVAASKNQLEGKLQIYVPSVPVGVLPVDAAKIPFVADYRLAGRDDFDPAAAAWLRGNGMLPAGRISADFLGKNDRRDAAYILVGKDGGRRIVLLAGGVNRYDLKFPYAGLIVRVPEARVSSIQWVGKPPQEPDGDGLLIVRKGDDPASGLVLFLSGTRILSAVPVNYQSISLP